MATTLQPRLSWQGLQEHCATFFPSVTVQQRKGAQTCPPRREEPLFVGDRVYCGSGISSRSRLQDSTRFCDDRFTCC